MRIPLLDILRGLSIIGMIVFHAHYMLVNIFDREFGYIPESLWRIIGIMIAITFITLSGYVNSLGYKWKSFRDIYSRAFRRALILGIVALTITLTTYTFIPEQRISWGIIHFFALSSLIQPLFARMWVWVFLFAFIAYSLGVALQYVVIDTSLLLPFGIMYPGFFSADYYPLFPWFGYILFGQGIAFFFEKYGAQDILRNLSFPNLSLLALLGRYSLMVYIIHTPILYLMFSLLF